MRQSIQGNLGGRTNRPTVAFKMQVPIRSTTVNGFIWCWLDGMLSLPKGRFPHPLTLYGQSRKGPFARHGRGLRAGERLLRRKGDFNLGLAAGRCRVHSGGDFGDAQTDNLSRRVAEDDDRLFVRLLLHW